MPPRKPPPSLFHTSIKATIAVVNVTSDNLVRDYGACEYSELEDQAARIKLYLVDRLPARIFEVLCAHRESSTGSFNSTIQLFLLMHPFINVFKKCEIDCGIPHIFWMKQLQSLPKLTVLDLKLICTDEILEVIGQNCLMLEEINTVSRVKVKKSPFNATVLSRNVSDAGLEYLLNLNHLRILSIDPPKNESTRVIFGRCITETGIRKIVSSLPALEELRVDSCDLGSTLVETDTVIPGPLRLRKINCNLSSAESVQRLIALCPYLKEFSLTNLSKHHNDEVLQQLASSHLQLSSVDLSYYSFTYSLQELLKIKGMYLTQFTLHEIENSITLEAIIAIGRNCPNLKNLTLMTQSKCLIVPDNYWCSPKIFSKLECLILGCNNFDLEKLLVFFLDNAVRLHRLTIQYNKRLCLDNTLFSLLSGGMLRNLTYLWMDSNLMVSNAVVKNLITCCNLLKTIGITLFEDGSDVRAYVKENNFDLKFTR